MTTTVSGAVAKRDNAPGALVEKYANDFATVLPSHIQPDTFVRLATSLVRRDKKLADAAQANPGSFLAALLDCARQGLEPGETYHLVPFKVKGKPTVTGIRDYTGDIELIYRAGAVSSVKCEVVYSNDGFTYDPETMDRPQHKVDWFSDDRGELIGVYAYAVMLNGATSQVVILNRKDIEKIKAVSKTATFDDSPWTLWPDRMWKKSAIKQLRKWVPTSAEYRREQLRAVAEADNVRRQIRPDGQPLPDLPPVDDDIDAIDAEIVADPETGELPMDGGDAA